MKTDFHAPTVLSLGIVASLFAACILVARADDVEHVAWTRSHLCVEKRRVAVRLPRSLDPPTDVSSIGKNIAGIDGGEAHNSTDGA